jgi:hypothetical protein
MSDPRKINFKPSTNPIRDGIEHEQSGGTALTNAADAVMLLLDHQSGLFQVVKDMEVAQLRANITMLAKLASLMRVPVITTASVPEGPNGPLMPEINEYGPCDMVQTPFFCSPGTFRVFETLTDCIVLKIPVEPLAQAIVGVPWKTFNESVTGILGSSLGLGSDGWLRNSTGRG